MFERLKPAATWKLAGAMLVIAAGVAGCAKSGASGWAQTSPVLRAEVVDATAVHADAATTSTTSAAVNLGMRDG